MSIIIARLYCSGIEGAQEGRLCAMKFAPVLLASLLLFVASCDRAPTDSQLLALSEELALIEPSGLLQSEEIKDRAGSYAELASLVADADCPDSAVRIRSKLLDALDAFAERAKESDNLVAELGGDISDFEVPDSNDPDYDAKWSVMSRKSDRWIDFAKTAEDDAVQVRKSAQALARMLANER